MAFIEKLATENLTIATFEYLPRLNDARTKAEGRKVYDNDMEVCCLKFVANRKTIGFFPAHEIFKWITDPSTGDREPLTYALAYPDQYRRFKNNELQVASGTPISEAAFISMGKRLELKALNIHTLDALAALDGQALKQLGQGGRTLKEQAQAYLDNAAGSADVTAIAAENADLKARLAALEAKINGVQSEEDEASDHDETGGGKIWDSLKDAEGQSPFLIMDAADIVNWLVDATGKQPKKGLKHAALVKLADTVNAELAKRANKAAAA